MIKMRKSTHYNGKDYREGDECKSPDPKTEARWIKNKIAEPVSKPCPEKPTAGPVKQPDK